MQATPDLNDIITADRFTILHTVVHHSVPLLADLSRAQHQSL
jgi:hypothetical protein